jgi:hypothetical protein
MPANTCSTYLLRVAYQVHEVTCSNVDAHDYCKRHVKINWENAAKPFCGSTQANGEET